MEFLSPISTELLKSVNLDDNTFKFLIVRHPFERLVSSYRYNLHTKREILLI